MQRRMKHKGTSAATLRTGACFDAATMQRTLDHGLLVLHKIAIQWLVRPTFWHWTFYMLADPLSEVSEHSSATGFQRLMHRLQPCLQSAVDLCSRLTCIYPGSIVIDGFLLFKHRYLMIASLSTCTAIAQCTAIAHLPSQHRNSAIHLLPSNLMLLLFTQCLWSVGVGKPCGNARGIEPQ